MIEQQGMSLYSFFFKNCFMVIIHTIHPFKEYNSVFFSKSHSCTVITTVNSLYQKEPNLSCFLALFHMLLDSVCKYFVQDFCVCIHKRHWPGVFFSLSGFGIRVILALKMTWKSLSPPPTLFFFSESLSSLLTCIYMCVSVCVRERDRKREEEIPSHHTVQNIFPSFPTTRFPLLSFLVLGWSVFIALMLLFLRAQICQGCFTSSREE